MPGRVTAVRVQDILRQLWFNWDLGVWRTPLPSCTVGANALYVSFWIIVEPIYPIRTEYMTLQLIDNSTGSVFASKSLWVSSAEGQGAGLEWTGNMPPSNYTLRCSVTP